MGALCAALVGAITSHTFGEDLQTLRDEVRGSASEKKKKEKKKKQKHDDHHHADCWGHCDDDDDDEENPLAELFGQIAWITLSSPFWGPHASLKDDLGDDGYFPRYPYKDGLPGYMVTDVLDASRVRLSNWSGRLRAEYADDFTDMSRIGGRLLFSTTSRFGLDTEWNHRREEFPSGARDELWTGDFNVVYRFAQSERAQFRAGLGLNWLHDQSDGDLGFNFTYGADFFPKDPWIFSGTIDWGTLGRASLFHGRASVGILIEGVEIFSGYDFFDVGNVQIHGLVGGLQIWF